MQRVALSVSLLAGRIARSGLVDRVELRLCFHVHCWNVLVCC